MSEKRKNETITAFCPDCDGETPHRLMTAEDDPVRRARCLACSHVHEIEAGQEEEPLHAEGDLGESEEELDAFAEGDAAPHADEEEAHEEVVDSSKLAEEEAEADADEEETAHALHRMPSRLMTEEAEEAESEEEGEDEEGEDAATGYGLSSYGRSSFVEEAPAPVDDEDEEAPKAKKRKSVRRKAPAAKGAGASRTWEQEMAEADEKKARSYSLSETYRLDEIIRHAKFGMGKVIEVVNPTKINVLFKDGRKMMLQGQR